MVRRTLPAAFVCAVAAACSSRAGSARPQSDSAGSVGARGEGVPAFWVRPGYRVDLVASGLEEARFLEMDDKGTLYVSQPGIGQIVSMRPEGGKYRQIGVFAKGLPSVHGLCFADGKLWFTQSGAIYRAADSDGDGVADKVETVVAEGHLPKGGGHWWRSILVGKGEIYTSIGDSGNITDPGDTERQKIYRFDKNGGSKHLFASGLRNTEKLRFRPGTQEVWGIDHGSDWFGGPLGDKQGKQPITDYNPPDEFNLYVDGGFYGHPSIVGNRVPRFEFQKRSDIIELADKTTVPEWCFPAHFAPNGFTFLTKDAFPGHRGDAFIAAHGSWNRTRRIGYRVDRVLFDKVLGKPFGAQMIVGTLSTGGEVLARPVDCVEAPDGSVLFSCDDTRSIYRISYVGAK